MTGDGRSNRLLPSSLNKGVWGYVRRHSRGTVVLKDALQARERDMCALGISLCWIPAFLRRVPPYSHALSRRRTCHVSLKCCSTFPTPFLMPGAALFRLVSRLVVVLSRGNILHCRPEFCLFAFREMGARTVCNYLSALGFPELLYSSNCLFTTEES